MTDVGLDLVIIVETSCVSRTGIFKCGVVTMKTKAHIDALPCVAFLGKRQLVSRRNSSKQLIPMMAQ
jgi:hypothetical protein